MVYRLYIGSDNGTHTVSDAQEQKINEILADAFESFTYHRATGVFREQREETIIITIANVPKSDVVAVAEKLREEFDQDGVGIETAGTYERVTTNGLGNS